MIFSEHDILWQGKIKSFRHGIYAGFNLCLFIISIISLIEFIFSAITNYNGIASVVGIIGFGLLIPIYLYYIRDYIKIAIHALTVKYIITKNGIDLVWWFMKINHVTIPFSDINKIDLVTYKNSNLSTIYFSTISYYGIVGYDYKNYDDRQCITFEQVQNGEEVYELLLKMNKLAIK